MEVKLFANLADLADTREVELDLDEGATVGDVLDALFAAHPALEEVVLAEDGDLEGHINVLVDGTNVRHDDEGMRTPVDPDAEVAIFPPVSGG